MTDRVTVTVAVGQARTAQKKPARPLQLTVTRPLLDRYSTVTRKLTATQPFHGHRWTAPPPIPFVAPEAARRSDLTTA